MGLFQANNIPTLKPGGGSGAVNCRNWETSRHRGNIERRNVQRSSSRAPWSSDCGGGSWHIDHNISEDVEMELPFRLDGVGEVRLRRSVPSPTATSSSRSRRHQTRTVRLPPSPKAFADQLALPFTRTFNHFLERSEESSWFESSTIVPVPETNTITSLNEYGSVAPTSPVTKSLERLLLSHLTGIAGALLDPPANNTLKPGIQFNTLYLEVMHQPWTCLQ